MNKLTNAHSVKMEWIKIEDLSRFLNQFQPKQIHPDDPKWWSFWREMKRKVIEGVWFEDFGKWRYGRGNLGFYHHYCTILDVDNIQKTYGKKIKPLIRDLEWHRSYYMAEARGFSGFTEDNKYTSDYRIFDIDINKFPKSDPNYSLYFTPDDKLKEFIPPRENLFRLHDSPVGLPLYRNQSKNFIELGSRGGGKSLYHILAEVKYELCTNGLKYYDDPKYKPKVLIDVGSGIKGKSLKTLNSLKASMDELAIDPDKGVWGQPNDSGKIYEPCPFYKIMEGSFDSDAKQGWTNEYDVKIGNNWTKRGDGSSIFHRVYSTNRKTGAEAGAGGRRNVIMYEEIGLFEELLTTWGSDDAVVKIDGVQFGVKIGIGTSGNMDTIKYAQTIFTHPEDYNCLEFPTKEGDSKQCFFLPAYMADKRFKDENGNTDVEAAKKHYEKYHEEKDKTGRQDVIIAARTNYPIEVDHMWISQQGKLLPYHEADQQEKKLLKNNLYESIGTAVELYWDEIKPNGVDYRIMHNAVPFYDDNIAQRTNLDGCVMIYEHPVFIKGQVPKDMYIITHDPYVSDNIDEGGSLGTTHVWVNPKYYSHVTTPLAATYIGKHPRGLDFYNQNLEKLVAYYGNPTRGLWYEAIRGERLRSYFIRKNKAYLLCLQPAFEQGSHIYLRHTNKTGFSVGNRISKITMVDRLHDLLLEEVEMNGTSTKHIFLINCIFTIRQIKAYDLEGNYDAVSSALGWPLALGEIEHRITEKLHKRNNPMSLFTKGLKR